MDFVYVGKIVGTHGIKGEVRILSNFSLKEKVFGCNKSIYVGDKKEKLIINGYRKHKNFDMITLEGFSNINEVLKYKGLKVFVLRADLELESNQYVLDDLIGMNIINKNGEYGKVVDIFDNNGNTLLEISFEKKYYIPYNSRYIKKVNVKEKTIEVIDVEGLIL